MLSRERWQCLAQPRWSWMAGPNVSMSASSTSDPTMLYEHPHFLAVDSLLIFWRCPRPCLLASRLALPTFALTLAMRLSERQNGRGKLLIRSRAPGSWQSLAHRTGPTPNLRQPAHRFANVCCPFAGAGALPVFRQRAKPQSLTSNRAAKS